MDTAPSNEDNSTIQAATVATVPVTTTIALTAAAPATTAIASTANTISAIATTAIATTAIGATAPTTSLPKNANINITGIFKVEKLGPIFRIVDPYVTKLNEKLAAEKRKTSAEDDAKAEAAKRKRGDLYADDTGPFWHKMSNPMITPPIITENLPRQFKDLPIFGLPPSSAKLDEYQNQLIREFVGGDLDDAEYEELENYCNPDILKTGKELKMASRVPIPGLIAKNQVKEAMDSDDENDNKEKKVGKDVQDLWTLQKLKMRQQQDLNNSYPKCLKYRGVKQLPLVEQEDNVPGKKLDPPDLEPGKDVLFRIRVYRPFTFLLTGEKHVRGRHSVFNCDIVLAGRQPLSALRDRFSCRNDVDMRLDMSAQPDAAPAASAKEVFPSGFLFINNVFYVDTRPGCRDTSAAARRWARDRGLGRFPVRDMKDWTLGEILVKLAHPEVYVHQGGCEHVFLFSQIRLLGRREPARLAAYPAHTATSQNQTIYCTTCAEFGARWLVTDSSRVPFDPAFFCELCFKQYLYKDKQKIGDFKAYAYRGNELNFKTTGKSVVSYI